MFGRQKREILREDITGLLSELAILLETGLSQKESLELMQKNQEKPVLSTLLDTLQNQVQQGTRLTETLSAYPQYFQPFLVELLRKAEEQNRLAEMLNKVVAYRQESDLTEINLANRVKVALAYPLAILLLVFFITALLLIFVVPVFSSLFKEFGAALPAPTAFIVWLSDIFADLYWYVLLVVFLLVITYSWYKTWLKDSKLYYLASAILLHLPGFGQLYHYVELARSLRTWNFMLAENIPLAKALESSAQTVQSPVYAKVLRQVSNAVATGTPLPEAIQQQHFFPKKLIHAATIGSKTGKLQLFLGKLADSYSQKAGLYFEPLMRVFTMFLIIITWFIVGFIVIAMYLPIFKIGSVVS